MLASEERSTQVAQAKRTSIGKLSRNGRREIEAIAW
jgi:hypothetical protein